MHIFIKGQLAALKSGSSFEFVAENRLFSGSDSYSLEITFPLRECPQNVAIFGNICRADVEANNVIFDCEIRDRTFRRFGCITITEISESEVKAQFLEGRSEQNFDTTFDDIYINELDLGYADNYGNIHYASEESSGNESASAPALAPGSHRPRTGNISGGSNTRPPVESTELTPEEAFSLGVEPLTAVVLPWVNDSKGYPNNFMDWDGDQYVWNDASEIHSWMPYLIFVAKNICEAIGYDYDLTPWEWHPSLKYLIVTNCLPASWNEGAFCKILPHWTVAEFFERLEPLLQGEFDIDHRAKTITFRFSEDVVSAIEPVIVDDVLSEHTVAVTVESPKCDYFYAKNLKYADCSHRMWNYYSCDWMMKGVEPKDAAEVGRYLYTNFARAYDTLEELLALGGNFKETEIVGCRSNPAINNLFYIRNLDMFFVVRIVDREVLYEENDSGHRKYYNRYKNILQPVNLFGAKIMDDSEDAQEETIELVPARIDWTEEKYGRCIFNSFSDNSSDSSDASVSNTSWMDMGDDERNAYWEDYYSTLDTKTYFQNVVENGDQSKADSYFDKIYIAYWDGKVPQRGRLPHPMVENVEIADDWSGYVKADFSLRLNDKFDHSRDGRYKVDPKKKFTFHFLVGSAQQLTGTGANRKMARVPGIPSPRAIFYIRGKRYICEKLTATVTDSGLSNLLKGEFYQIVD